MKIKLIIILLCLAIQMNLISQNSMIKNVVDIYWEDDKLEYIDKGYSKNYSWSTLTKYDNGKRIEMIAYGLNNSKIDRKNTYEYRDSLLIKEEIFFPNEDRPNQYTIYEYDLKGNNTRKTDRNKQDEIQYDYQYSYNGKNQLIEQIAYNYLGDPTMKIDYKYDQKGNLIEEKRKDYFDDDSLVKYKYDEKGNEIDKQYFSPISELRNHWKSEYNIEGLKIRSEFWVKGIKCINRTKFKYDSESGIETRILINPEDNSQKEQVIQTLEDQYGNWIEKKILENGKLKSVHKRQIEYAI